MQPKKFTSIPGNDQEEEPQYEAVRTEQNCFLEAMTINKRLKQAFHVINI